MGQIVSRNVSLEEMEMFNNFRGELNMSQGLKAMVHQVCDKRYSLVELLHELLELDKDLKSIEDNLSEKDRLLFNNAHERIEQIWQILSR
ncbi:hypothetical protein [[Clostridium] fimetarium]|uniref:Uncharacterized protein n=1 Tax=[Clostridium] fimetarium TaxID=99656 RepID=A0A1I0PZY4_9FIRM|nr:hypothetical protein [[Clostridium] fimetarium]SEW20093.1 hypothetical protein SAMN05421659_106172 [[Clostridium] fimetarium]